MTDAPLAALPEQLLLDTHVFLWWADGQLARVPKAVQARIEAAPTVFVSLASAWELNIKTAVSKTRLGVTFAYALDVNRFAALPITLDHVGAVADLPAPQRHRDPFDRMLIAQARHEGLTIVTHDTAFRDYSVPILWA